MQVSPRDYFAAITTGVLIPLSLPPFSLHGLIWIAFVPLLSALDGKAWRTRLHVGFVAGVVGYAGAYAWLPASIALFFDVGGELAAAAFVAFVLWHSLHFALFGIVAGGSWTGPGRVAAAALAWSVIEALFPVLFPFSIANALQPHVPFIQLAAVTGVAGLSFAVVLCNALLFDGWRRLRAGGKPAVPLALALAVVAGLDVFGRWQLSNAGAGVQVAQRRSIVLVQGNIEAKREASRAWLEESLQVYGRLTIEASQPRPDLILWPELAVRAALPSDAEVMQRLFDIARRADTVLLVGAGNRDRAGHEGNAAFLISPHGDVLGAYEKRRMLPFAEQAPAVTDLVGGYGSAAAHRETAASLLTHAGRLAPSICYEATFPGFFRDGVNEGALLLVNLTNDVWFGDTAGPYHHLQAAALRAVEMRRWLVRAANSGISAVIDDHGRIVAQTSLFERTVVRADVPLLGSDSPYVRWGNWFAVMCAAALMGLWLGKLFSSKGNNVQLAV